MAAIQPSDKPIIPPVIGADHGRRVVSAIIATAFAQDDAEAARGQWRKVADQLRPKTPKLAALMDEAESDVLAYMAFPAAHRTKLHSTNPIERLNGEIKRRTEVVGIFPNEAAITRLIGAILYNMRDERPASRLSWKLFRSIRGSSNACRRISSAKAANVAHGRFRHEARYDGPIFGWLRSRQALAS
jgi:hypothetical protein